jgi:glycosyltransferase involved in cell wall biosynthesis
MSNQINHLVGNIDLPLISVLVLTYNQEKFISETINSILSQVCSFSYEIIIGNDCSTDRTTLICEDYVNKFPEKIKLINREKNVGLTKNYVDCLKICRGTYIAQCAGDDYWIDKHKLQ